jgi:hypothetical protein
MNINENYLKYQEESNIIPHSKQKSKKLIYPPFECINFSKFDEMHRNFESFYKELDNNLEENINDTEVVKKLENKVALKAFYVTLEKLLKEIFLIKEDILRIRKIDDIYRWYKNKVSNFKTEKIVIKNSKNQSEKFPVSNNYKKIETDESPKFQPELEKEKKKNLEENEITKIK